MAQTTQQRFAAIRRELLQTAQNEVEVTKWSDHKSINSRIVRCLLNADCATLDDVVQKVMKAPTLPANFGAKAFVIVYDKLRAIGKI